MFFFSITTQPKLKNSLKNGPEQLRRAREAKIKLKMQKENQNLKSLDEKPEERPLRTVLFLKIHSTP